MEIKFLKLPADIEHALNDACYLINDWATKKGWNDVPDSLDHKLAQIALMHSELSECVEFLRAKHYTCPNPDHGDFYGGSTQGFCKCGTELILCAAPDDHVPTLTGEAAELADVLIRIFHYCGQRNINLGEAVRLKHEYNITRPYKHGKQI